MATEEEKETLILSLSAQLEKLERLQRQRNDDAAALQRMEGVLAQHVSEANDIQAYLTNELQLKALENDELKNVITKLQYQIQKVTADGEIKLQAEREERERERSNLMMELEQSRKELKGLEVFQREKQQLERDLHERKLEMAKMQSEHLVAISNLERKLVQERDQLRREMLAKVQETRNAILKLTDENIETTTKRTILENEQLQTELLFLERQTQRILEKNNAILAESEELKRQLSVQKGIAEAACSKNAMLIRAVKAAATKLKDSEQDAASNAKQAAIIKFLESKITLLESTISRLQQQIASAPQQASARQRLSPAVEKFIGSFASENALPDPLDLVSLSLSLRARFIESLARLLEVPIRVGSQSFTRTAPSGLPPIIPHPPDVLSPSRRGDPKERAPSSNEDRSVDEHLTAGPLFDWGQWQAASNRPWGRKSKSKQ